MFVSNDSDNVNTLLQTSSDIKTQSLILAEWNLNLSENIKALGNYRYRPTVGSPNEANFGTIRSEFQEETESTETKYYYGATESDVIVDGGYKNDDSNKLFISQNQKNKLLFSLEDCLNRFRPRSGINKMVFYKGDYIGYQNPDMFRRPRYYLADKDDKFKYWTSFRTDGDSNTIPPIERGISKNYSGNYYIDDAAPFVVYKNPVPANRIVIKMQTHVGDIDLGPFKDKNGINFSDPFYGSANKAVPKSWKVQTLNSSNQWNTIQEFATGSFSDKIFTDADIPTDGYFELSYGIVNIPTSYKNNFVHVATYSNVNFLPVVSIVGYAYLVKSSDIDPGIFYIWTGSEYAQFRPYYGWYQTTDEISNTSNFVTDLVAPETFFEPTTNSFEYRELKYIYGIRIVVEKMNKNDSTFDLIEMSPRLAVNLTDKTISYSIKKSASDLGVSGLPVGQILASTGNISIFDYDQAFNSNNTDSILNIKDLTGTIVSNFSSKNMQVNLYEIIYDDDNGKAYYIPIKTFYVDGFPQINNEDRQVSLELRDTFKYFESLTAPQIILSNVSFSMAVCLLLDSIGFSNYSFLRVADETETIIPYFYVAPETSVAQVLSDLAISTQTAIFFNEYNELIFMSKNYMLPEESQRSIDTTLIGTKDYQENGIIKNETSSVTGKLANIVSIVSQNAEVFNDGSITYATRYVQRMYSSLKQASTLDNEKTWIYKPVLLWEVSPELTTKSINEQSNTQSAYSLTAIPLNTKLFSTLPAVNNGVVINNTIDFGEGIYWIARYAGYLYANGEIIRYDAVEYNVSGIGNVWISSVLEYQNYFSKIPFNGKIYPTGKVRIYSEPYYDEENKVLQEGLVSKHGRGQFGTEITEHNAGIKDTTWENSSYTKSYSMDSQIFTSLTPSNMKSTKVISKSASVSGVIKNFLATSYPDEATIKSLKSTQAGTVQSSALVMTGASFTSSENPLDYVSYTYKALENRFVHFGTRLRIVGSLGQSSDTQIPYGNSTYYTVNGQNISGSSGGIAFFVNPIDNSGYYLEISALTSLSTEIGDDGTVKNMFLYKTKNNSSPTLLWKGLTQILVDDGNFTGQYRMTGEELPTVYDLAIEYEPIGSDIKKGIRFYIYLNEQLVTTVEDTSPLKIYNNIALFVRGSSKVMFENVYALTSNYAQNPESLINAPISSVFNAKQISVNDSFRKYSISGMIQSTYLSGVSSSQPPIYNMYYDEFGTIMREASYFNVRYDKAYPALYSKLAPTFSTTKGYTVSGYKSGAYAAEFLIFNNTDTVLNLDDTSGNYLRILGLSFTQEANHVLTVDEYFNKNSDLSSPIFENGKVKNLQSQETYSTIKSNRLTYGKKEFALNAPYIQNQDSANNLMGWIISKLLKPRKSVGLELFGLPTLQLGDIVKIDYIDTSGIENFDINSRYVVYYIEHNRSDRDLTTRVYLSEVV